MDMFKNLTRRAEEQEDERPVVNSEMDDLPLPEGAEMPSIDDMQKTVEALSKAEHEMSADKTPVAPQANLMSFPRTHTQHTSDELPDDLLTVQSDVNRQADQIGQMSSDIAVLQSQTKILPEIDAKVRKTATEMKEMSDKVSSLIAAMNNVTKSMNQYQTDTAKAVAHMERRLLLIKPNDQAAASQPEIPIPEEVEFTKTRDEPGTSSKDSTSAPIARIPTKPKKFDMSDF